MISRTALFAPLAGLMLASTAPLALAAPALSPQSDSQSLVTAVQKGGDGGRSGGGGSAGRSGGGGQGFTGGGRGGGRDVRRGGDSRSSANRGDRNWGGRDHRGRGRHSRRDGGGFGIYIGPGYGYYDYYSGECEWLRRRALSTGSSYWWRRYRNCVD